MIAGSLCLPAGLGGGEAPDEGGAGEGPKGRAEGDARCRHSYLPRLLPAGRARSPFCLPLHPAQCSPGSWLELRTPPVPDPGASLASCGCSLPPPSPSPCAAASFPPALGTSHMLFPLPRIFSTLSFFFSIPKFYSNSKLKCRLSFLCPGTPILFHAPYS